MKKVTKDLAITNNRCNYVGGILNIPHLSPRAQSRGLIRSLHPLRSVEMTGKRALKMTIERANMFVSIASAILTAGCNVLYGAVEIKKRVCLN